MLYRRDLRMMDHPALAAAAKDGRVICGYIKKQTLTSAHDFWTLRHVNQLKKDLNQEGLTLLMGEKSLIEQVKTWCTDYEIDAVYVNRSYLHDEITLEEELIAALKKINVDVHRFVGDVLSKPGSILTNKGEYYKVFTPFYKALRQSSILRPTPKPETYHGIKVKQGQFSVDEPAWFKKIVDKSPPGEQAAMMRLESFCEDYLSGYSHARDRPALEETSRLSVYLSIGAISPRIIYQRVMAENTLPAHVDEEKEAFIRQLMWRDFSYQQLYQHPKAETEAMRKEFDYFKWLNDEDAIDRWKKGQTGYPLIDAGMRELYETGYMHNRVRMVVASFLVKHLLVDWRIGLHYFSETLIDHDRQNNALGWQWVMGSGFDASPYFRIFNPITQAEKFDPDGSYIKRYVPELSKLEGRDLFRPFEAKVETLTKAGVTLGKDYPLPLVDHKKARQRALERYQDVKGKS